MCVYAVAAGFYIIFNMLEKEAKEIYKRALEKYGSSRQVDKTIEELGELATALMKFKHAEATMEDVVTEIADVFITVYQMSVAFGFQDVCDEIAYKTRRLEEKMDEEVLKDQNIPEINYYYYGG